MRRTYPNAGGSSGSPHTVAITNNASATGTQTVDVVGARTHSRDGSADVIQRWLHQDDEIKGPTEEAVILGISKARVWQLALKEYLPWELADNGRR